MSFLLTAEEGVSCLLWFLGVRSGGERYLGELSMARVFVLTPQRGSWTFSAYNLTLKSATPKPQ